MLHEVPVLRGENAGEDEVLEDIARTLRLGDGCVDEVETHLLLP